MRCCRFLTVGVAPACSARAACPDGAGHGLGGGPFGAQLTVRHRLHASFIRESPKRATRRDCARTDRNATVCFNRELDQRYS